MNLTQALDPVSLSAVKNLKTPGNAKFDDNSAAEGLPKKQQRRLSAYLYVSLRLTLKIDIYNYFAPCSHFIRDSISKPSNPLRLNTRVLSGNRKSVRPKLSTLTNQGNPFFPPNLFNWFWSRSVELSSPIIFQLMPQRCGNNCPIFLAIGTACKCVHIGLHREGTFARKQHSQRHRLLGVSVICGILFTLDGCVALVCYNSGFGSNKIMTGSETTERQSRQYPKVTIY
jgi:hypothetical protein